MSSREGPTDMSTARRRQMCVINNSDYAGYQDRREQSSRIWHLPGKWSMNGLSSRINYSRSSSWVADATTPLSRCRHRPWHRSFATTCWLVCELPRRASEGRSQWINTRDTKRRLTEMYMTICLCCSCGGGTEERRSVFYYSYHLASSSVTHHISLTAFCRSVSLAATTTERDNGLQSGLLFGHMVQFIVNNCFRLQMICLQYIW